MMEEDNEKPFLYQRVAIFEIILQMWSGKYQIILNIG